MALSIQTNGTAIGNCLISLYSVGTVSDDTFGCIVSDTILYVSLLVILGVVLLRFVLAIWFSYFISKSLGHLKQQRQSKKRTVSENGEGVQNDKSPNSNNPAKPHDSEYTEELYTVMLVTCYSEGYDGIKSTLDSLADTSYNDDFKLLFIVADGQITGSTLFSL